MSNDFLQVNRIHRECNINLSLLNWNLPKKILEEGMAIHSSILSWRIPWTEDPSGLMSMGSQSQTQLKQLSKHAEEILRTL